MKKLFVCLFLFFGFNAMAQSPANDRLYQLIGRPTTDDHIAWHNDVMKCFEMGADNHEYITELLFAAVAFGDEYIFKEAHRHGGNIWHKRSTDHNSNVAHYCGVYGKDNHICGIIYYIHQTAPGLFNQKNSENLTPLEIAERGSSNSSYPLCKEAYKCMLKLQ